MRATTLIVRYFLGAWMLVNGLNYFLNMYPLPQLSPAAQAFLVQLEVSRLFDLAKIIEIVSGALLVTNLFVPAAVAMCMPVSVVIFFNDLLLERGPVGYIAGPVTLVLNLFLVYAYSQYFMPLLTLRSQVSGAEGLRTWRSTYTSDI